MIVAALIALAVGSVGGYLMGRRRREESNPTTEGTAVRGVRRRHEE